MQNEIGRRALVAASAAGVAVAGVAFVAPSAGAIVPAGP